jgi:hypothetical protein
VTRVGYYSFGAAFNFVSAVRVDSFGAAFNLIVFIEILLMGSTTTTGSAYFTAGVFWPNNFCIKLIGFVSSTSSTAF